MKEYIGIKKIEAEPMTRGDYNNYRGWTIPADENPADEGYIVRHSDDYVSWSPKKQFEESYTVLGTNPLIDSVLLMKSSDHRDRLKAEYIQVKTRCDKLNSMITLYDSGNIDIAECVYDLLKNQYDCMNKYADLLKQRIELEGIKL